MAQVQVADKGRNLFLRILSAAILGCIVICSLYLGLYVFTALVGLVLLLAIFEWINMARGHPALAALGCLYIGLCGLCVAGIYCLYSGPNVTLTLFALVWVSDTSAYATGKLVGGPKLAPRISPNKTWAGAVGGLLGPLVVSLGFLAFRLPHANPVFVIGLAIAVSLATELGDLLESAAKRYFGVKDSGWLIPGHGGILDRIDGLLLAAPVFLTITTISERYL